MQDKIVVLGAEVPSGRAVAKKLRAEQFCCVLATSSLKAQDVRAMDVRGIVIAGEASEGASAPDPALLALGLPVLALGSAASALLAGIGQPDGSLVEDVVMPVYYRDAHIFNNVESGERWIGRAENYSVQAPYRVIADGEGMAVAFGNEEANIYLMQFLIERNDPEGAVILRTFAQDLCGCTPWWTTETIIEEITRQIAGAAGAGDAVCAISGGLDSTVAAVLAKRAMGDRVRCVFVDTGLLRLDEADGAQQYFSQELGLPFKRVDAAGRIMDSLHGLRDMEAKWQVIDSTIQDVLREEAGSSLFIKGTNYADIHDGQVIEAPQEMMRTIEPLGMLYKDEIRRLGQHLGLPDDVLNRQPFPGMGLAARIRGQVTAEKLEVLRMADAIYMDEIATSGLNKRLDRYFAMLDDAECTCVVVLRAMQGSEPNMNVARLPYDMLERTVERIKKELPSVERVLYDITPGMVEWPL